MAVATYEGQSTNPTDLSAGEVAVAIALGVGGAILAAIIDEFTDSLYDAFDGDDGDN